MDQGVSDALFLGLVVEVEEDVRDVLSLELQGLLAFSQRQYCRLEIALCECFNVPKQLAATRGTGSGSPLCCDELSLPASEGCLVCLPECCFGIGLRIRKPCCLSDGNVKHLPCGFRSGSHFEDLRVL